MSLQDETPERKRIIEYYVENQRSIQKVTAIPQEVFSRMKAHIERFEHHDDRVDLASERFVCEYTIFLPNQLIFKVSFVFNLSPYTQQASIKVRSSYTKEIVVATTLFVRVTELVRSLKEELRRQAVGPKNETFFLEEVLIPLKESHPECIMYAHRSSKHRDYKHGIDFVVGFAQKSLDNVFKVEFNLKSSDKYLDKHKARYPNVSTFIFTPQDLSNKVTLERRLLAFFDAVVTKGVSHY